MKKVMYTVRKTKTETCVKLLIVGESSFLVVFLLRGRNQVW